MALRQWFHECPAISPRPSRNSSTCPGLHSAIASSAWVRSASTRAMATVWRQSALNFSQRGSPFGSRAANQSSTAATVWKRNNDDSPWPSLGLLEERLHLLDLIRRTERLPLG